MTKQQFLDEIARTFQECLDIAKKKNADYAGSDDPFKNFNNSLLVGVDPARAILVRVTDKISRISNLLDKNPEVTDEKLDDTIKDAITYLAILINLLTNKKL